MKRFEVKREENEVFNEKQKTEELAERAKLIRGRTPQSPS